MSYIPIRLPNIVGTIKTILIGLVIPEGILTTYYQIITHMQIS